MAAYWETAAHSAYDMFSKYKYLIVNLDFSRLSFWSANFFLIAPFPDHCLLVPLVPLACEDAGHTCIMFLKAFEMSMSCTDI